MKIKIFLSFSKLVSVKEMNFKKENPHLFTKLNFKMQIKFFSTIRN